MQPAMVDVAGAEEIWTRSGGGRSKGKREEEGKEGRARGEEKG